MDSLIANIISYAQQWGLSDKQKETIEEIIIKGNWVGDAAEDTDGGFTINLRKLDEPTLTLINNLLQEEPF